MIKLSDYVFEFLADRGVRDIFTVSGGGIMHLTDSAGRNPRIRVWCNHNEQASSICAEAYARVQGSVGVCLVTTGPGSTNALTGVACAYVDSIPMIVIAGQVRTGLIADYGLARQLGPQEVDSVGMARGVTSYSTTVTDPREILASLEEGYQIATSGRPGPAWINIPLDIQACEVDISKLLVPRLGLLSKEAELKDIDVLNVIDLIKQSKRPIIIAGNGIHLARAERALECFIAITKIPTLVTINALDLLDEEDPAAIGRFGPSGQRRANFALQNADLIVSLGASMGISSIGFNSADFAPMATRVMVNIDQSELDKANYVPDLKVRADVGHFIHRFLRLSNANDFLPSTHWLEVCAMWKRRYPLLSGEHEERRDVVNTYVLADRLSRRCSASDIVVTGNSLDIVSVYQAWRVKRGQRVFTNANFGPMGWDLPAAIGAWAARGDARIICFTGDGSIQFNIQELMTIGLHRMNIKIFVINNQGYNSIRTMQDTYFEGRHVGASAGSGIGNPDFKCIAAAYGLSYEKISRNVEIEDVVDEAFGDDCPWLCELVVAPDQGRTPRIVSDRKPDGSMVSKPLHDMYPFLAKEEVEENMTLFLETSNVKPH